MTPEEQYVKCMDAAYAAADKETCHKMMRKAEGVLRGEFGVMVWRLHNSHTFNKWQDLNANLYLLKLHMD